MSCEGDSFWTKSRSDSGAKPGTKRRSGLDSKRKKKSTSNASIDSFMKMCIFVSFLGKGAFGVVNLMKHQTTSKHYAVKVVKKTDPITNAKTRNEIELGMKLGSQHICKVHEYHEDDEHLHIFMEYLEGMDLCDFIRKYPMYFINNPKSFWIVIESILRGLSYLHSKKIAHFDVKPENIYFLVDGGAKLIDLGLSMKVDKTTKCFSGTGAYMAPEFFHLCRSTGLPADIWSLGMTAYAMLRASLPISSRNKDPRSALFEIYAKIESLLRKGSFNLFKKRSERIEILEMEEFIASCLIVNPDERQTADDLLKKIPK